MRKAFALLLLVTSLLLALAGCGGKNAPANDAPGGSDNTAAADEPRPDDNKAPQIDADTAITEDMVRNHAVTPAEDFRYDVADDGVTIRSYKGSDTIVVIPEEIEGKKVVKFKYLVFANESPVRAVLFPESVKEFGSVFTNSKAIEVVICEGATKIGEFAFANCPALREVYFDKEIEELGPCAFTGCGTLKELHFTDALRSIAAPSVFDACDNLTIYAPAGSYAETFAKEYSIPFEVEEN